jgi:hypothetical protein
MAKCWVHGCESDGFKLHSLKERQEPFEFPSDVVVCELHRSELAGENPEWVMFNNLDGSRDLYVGASLRQLNEYIVVEPPETATVYALGGRRQFSSPGESGVHMPVRVRQRGREQAETLTLVMSRDMLIDFADRIQHFAERYRRQGSTSG